MELTLALIRGCLHERRTTERELYTEIYRVLPFSKHHFHINFTLRRKHNERNLLLII